MSAILAAFSSLDLSASQQSPQIVEPCVAQDSPTCKLLYVTPEQFCNNTLLQELLVALRRRQLFPRLVIDEVLLATAAAKGTCQLMPTGSVSAASYFHPMRRRSASETNL